MFVNTKFIFHYLLLECSYRSLISTTGNFYHISLLWHAAWTELMADEPGQRLQSSRKQRVLVFTSLFHTHKNHSSESGLSKSNALWSFGYHTYVCTGRKEKKPTAADAASQGSLLTSLINSWLAPSCLEGFLVCSAAQLGAKLTAASSLDPRVNETCLCNCST